MADATTDIIIDYLLKERQVDFSGYHHSMVARQVDKRLKDTQTCTVPDYYEFLQSHSDEIDQLIDSLIINVSSFFRDPLVFSYLHARLLPKLISKKSTSGTPSLRIWSAGCAAGEEPFSLAMDISNILERLNTNIMVTIFATDMDLDAVNKGREAVYSQDSLNNIRFEYLKYFTQSGTVFHLKPEIKHLVNFSQYDLLDKKSYSPPESIYGGFDMVLCRNVLIYYDTRSQNAILTKLHRSLNPTGYLILGEAETLTAGFSKCFEKIVDHSQIFQKMI